MQKIPTDPAASLAHFQAGLQGMVVGPKDAPRDTATGQAGQGLNAKNNFGTASGSFNRWSVELTPGQTLEDALRPTFWSLKSEDIMRDRSGGARNNNGRGDIIEVRKFDGPEFYAELYVLEAGKGYVKTVLIREAQAPMVVVPEDSTLGVRWNIGRRWHEVYYKENNESLRGGFQSAAAAAEWLAGHLGKMAA